MSDGKLLKRSSHISIVAKFNKYQCVIVLILYVIKLSHLFGNKGGWFDTSVTPGDVIAVIPFA